LEQTATLLQDIGAKPNTAIVDLGYRGVDADCVPVQIIHRGKYKTLTATQRSWLKRRQAIEPAIGHAKADHRMDRCWLKGSEGDALHAVLCAAGFNIRWLLRAIASGREGRFSGLQSCGAVCRTRHAGGSAGLADGHNPWSHWPPCIEAARATHPSSINSESRRCAM
jgi:hypothetical protein